MTNTIYFENIVREEGGSSFSSSSTSLTGSHHEENSSVISTIRKALTWARVFIELHNNTVTNVDHNQGSVDPPPSMEVQSSSAPPSSPARLSGTPSRTPAAHHQVHPSPSRFSFSPQAAHHRVPPSPSGFSFSPQAAHHRVPPSPSGFSFSPQLHRSGSVHLNMSQVIKATKNFSPLLKIGESEFGHVYRAELEDGQIVTIKRAKKEHRNSLQPEFSSEVQLLTKIEHINLVRLLGYVGKGNERIIITEYVPNGTLREHLDGQHGKILDFNQRLEICINVAHALTFLHLYAGNQIIHRDVKSSNILLTENFRAKVADFGLARLGTSEDDLTKLKGTVGYLDPEYKRTYQLTPKSDVFSFGILMTEILTGRCPVESRKDSQERITITWAFNCYNEGNVSGLLDPLMNETLDVEILKSMFLLAFQCAAPKREDRPNMKEVGERLWVIRKDYLKSVRKENTSSNSCTNVVHGVESQGTVDPVPSAEVPSTSKLPRKPLGLRGNPFRAPASHLRVPPRPSRFSLSPLSRSGSVHLSMSQVKKATQNFSPLLKISEGGFGDVYRAQLQDGQIVAMKRAKKGLINSVQSEFCSEVELLAKIKHRNLVKLLGYVDKGNERIIITEHVRNGTLREHLDGQHGKILDFNQRLEICINVAHALTFLHLYAGNLIIHRDVKSSNILLTENFRAKVADFGLARLGTSEDDLTKLKGTVGYLDPEYKRTYQLTPKSDVFSFGILMTEILTGRCPVESRKDSQERITITWAFNCYNEGNVSGLLDPLMNETLDVEILKSMFLLAFQCAAPKREDRPNMKEVGERLWVIRKDYLKSVRKENTSSNSCTNVVHGVESQGTVDPVPSAEVPSTSKLPRKPLGLRGNPFRAPASHLRVPPRPSRFSLSPLSRSGSVHLSMSQVKKATQNFSPLLKISEGGFGDVYRAQLQDGQIVAMKRAKKGLINSVQSEFCSEVELLAKIEHRNLVKLLGYVDKGNERIIITEHVRNGTLREHLDGRHEKILDFNQRLEICIDVAHALTYLHHYAGDQIIHRDVKSSNILLTERFRAKVANFGCARLGTSEGDDQMHVLTEVRGTVGYLDPEYMRTYQLTPKSDVFSFGIFMTEILTGRRPVEPRRDIEERITIRWAFSLYNEGNVGGLLDPMMKEKVDIKLLKRMFRLAFQCAAPTREDRPNMKEVGEQLWDIRKEDLKSVRKV